jgi:hypothetical protein
MTPFPLLVCAFRSLLVPKVVGCCDDPLVHDPLRMRVDVIVRDVPFGLMEFISRDVRANTC